MAWRHWQTGNYPGQGKVGGAGVFVGDWVFEYNIV